MNNEDEYDIDENVTANSIGTVLPTKFHIQNKCFCLGYKPFSKLNYIFYPISLLLSIGIFLGLNSLDKVPIFVVYLLPLFLLIGLPISIIMLKKNVDAQVKKGNIFEYDFSKELIKLPRLKKEFCLSDIYFVQSVYKQDWSHPNGANQLQIIVYIEKKKKKIVIVKFSWNGNAFKKTIKKLKDNTPIPVRSIENGILIKK